MRACMCLAMHLHVCAHGHRRACVFMHVCLHTPQHSQRASERVGKATLQCHCGGDS